MQQPIYPSFDLKDIVNSNQVRAAFLLIVGFLIGIWFFAADSALERIIAGILIVVVLVLFLFFTQRSAASDASPAVAAPGLGTEVTPATEIATREEVASPPPELLGSPDGSYIINRPPPGWHADQMTVAEWQAKLWEISDPTIRQQLFSNIQPFDPNKEVLVFAADRSVTMYPIPGKFTIEGRSVPSALGQTLVTRLSILPLPIHEIPLYMERPIEHYIVKFGGQLASSGVLTLNQIEQSVIQPGKRKTITVAAWQNLEHVRLDDLELDSLKVSRTIIGIEGEYQHYLLILDYHVSDSTALPDKQERDVLMSLVNSFRPLGSRDSEEPTDAANKAFQQLIDENAPQMFYRELEMLLLRLKGWDLDDPRLRGRAIELLKPFDALYTLIQLQNESLDELWKALHAAEAGEAGEFKEQVRKLTQVVADGMTGQAPPEETEALPPTDASEDGAEPAPGAPD